MIIICVWNIRNRLLSRLYISIYSKQESAISCISFDFLSRRKSSHICIIWRCDEVSQNEWKRNKLYAECAKLRRVICLMRLSLSGSFDPPSSLSVCVYMHARAYIFFFLRRNFTADDRVAVGFRDWHASMTGTVSCHSSPVVGRWNASRNSHPCVKSHVRDFDGL